MKREFTEEAARVVLASIKLVEKTEMYIKRSAVSSSGRRYIPGIDVSFKEESDELIDAVNAYKLSL